MIYLETHQTIFPKSIYIGDKAELRCQFTSEAKLVTGSLSAQNFKSQIDYSTYEIKDISLQLEGFNSYNLTVNFVPWHTGAMQFPDFELYLANGDGSELYGTIKFEEIKILSLVEQNNVNTLQEPSSPLLLPGTVYKLYGTLAAIIILLIIFIRLIIKRQSVAFWFKTIKLKHRYKKNKRNTIRALKALQPQKESATALQKIMRSYLENRLEYPFTKTLTSEMSRAFDEATLSLADEKRQTAFEDIISVFIRTDYIRFSSSTGFENGEFTELTNKLLQSIYIIEEEGEKNA